MWATVEKPPHTRITRCLRDIMVLCADRHRQLKARLTRLTGLAGRFQAQWKAPPPRAAPTCERGLSSGETGQPTEKGFNVRGLCVGVRIMGRNGAPLHTGWGVYTCPVILRSQSHAQSGYWGILTVRTRFLLPAVQSTLNTVKRLWRFDWPNITYVTKKEA